MHVVRKRERLILRSSRGCNKLQALQAGRETRLFEIHKRRECLIYLIVEEKVYAALGKHRELHNAGFELVDGDRNIIAMEIAAMKKCTLLDIDYRIVRNRIHLD